MRGLIRYFCVVKKQKPGDINREVVAAYGNVVSREKVAKKYCRTNVHDEERDGRLTDEFVRKVEKLIQDDRRLAVDELHEMYPEVGRTVLHETITDRLKFRKLCTIKQTEFV